MFKSRYLISYVLILVGFVLLPNNALAGCFPYVGAINYSFGNVAVLPSAQIGDTIAHVRPPGIGSAVYCLNHTATFGTLKAPLFPTKSPVIPTESGLRTYPIYETNIRGVGLLVGYVYGLETLYWPNGFIYLSSTSALSIYLIKTGDIPSGGSLASGNLANSFFDGTITIAHNLSGGTITPPAIPTCSISAGDVNKVVTLDPVKVGDFNTSPGIGDKPFTLTVDNCQSNPATANFTFTGTPDGSNPVIFKNGADAPGVGVRLFTTTDNQTIGANDTTNVRSIPVTGGQAVLGLTAQYYKTGASVGAGQVSSRITVTTSYN